MSFALSHHHAVVSDAKAHLGMLPPNLRAGLARYFDLGIEPGRFLCAVLENDLVGATVRSSVDDAAVYEHLRTLALFLVNYAPSQSYGSKEKRLLWQEQVRGIHAETARLNDTDRQSDTERPPAPSVELPDLEVPRG